MHQFLLILVYCSRLIDVVRPEASGDVGPPKERQLAGGDLSKLQGTWERVAMEVAGTQVPDEDLKGWLATHGGDRLTLKVDNRVYRHGIVTLDPSRSP